MGKEYRRKYTTNQVPIRQNNRFYDSVKLKILRLNKMVPEPLDQFCHSLILKKLASEALDLVRGQDAIRFKSGVRLRRISM